MDIAKCLRIFEPDPDDDFITKREAAIKDLRTRLVKKRTIDHLMGLGSGVCEVFRDSPSMPDTLATHIEAAIKKQSASFVRDNRDLEMGVCAAAAVVQAVESGRTMGDGWHVSDVSGRCPMVGAQLLAYLQLPEARRISAAGS